MDSSIYLMIKIGPMALIFAMLAASALYIRYVHAPQPKKELSLPRYLLVGAVVDIVGFVLGTVIGIEAACSPADAGNLCGLVGLFGFGPFFAALAIIAFAYLKTRDARKAT